MSTFDHTAFMIVSLLCAFGAAAGGDILCSLANENRSFYWHGIVLAALLVILAVAQWWM